MFVEVTVDPNSNTSAFIVEDRIRFVTNTVEQHVDLVLMGEMLYFITKVEIGLMNLTNLRTDFRMQ